MMLVGRKDQSERRGSCEQSVKVNMTSMEWANILLKRLTYICYDSSVPVSRRYHLVVELSTAVDLVVRQSIDT